MKKINNTALAVAIVYGLGLMGLFANVVGVKIWIIGTFAIMVLISIIGIYRAK